MYERIGHYKTGFYYINKETKQKITDESILAWIKDLKIPPAYNNVIINHNKGHKILAYGYDSKMRKQVIYHPEYVQMRQDKKYRKIMQLHPVFQNIMKKIADDILSCNIKTKEIAIIIYLIVNCGFRIGNKKYEKLNNSYGISTIRFRHVSFKKGNIIFDFIGKKGVRNVSKCDNMTIYKYLMKKQKKLSDEDYVFTNISSQDVNAYLKEFDEKISSKDLRTWNANLSFLQFVKEACELGSKNPVKDALQKVSDKLHNTAIVCKKSYIDPKLAAKIKK